MESLAVSRELGLNRFVTEQPAYNLLDRRIERELIPFARTHGFAILPWSPLGGGLLTGRYRDGARRPEGMSRFAGEDGYLDSILTEAFFERIGPFCDLAAGRGVTPSQLALAWCAHQPGITSPIIGPRTLEHLEEHLAALAITLNAEDHAALDRLFPPGGMISPFFERDSSPHVYR
jgi:aryl-alcohol dehydrogenase-like predicted oxidoreductase